MYATVADVRRRWIANQPLTYSDDSIQSYLDDAESIVNTRFPQLKQAVALGTVDGSLPQRIVARMVVRVLLNPSGKRTTGQTSGPHSVQETFTGDNPGELELTDDQLRDLREALATRKRQRAFTVSMIPQGR